jgi:DNA polymerase III subunit delta
MQVRPESLSAQLARGLPPVCVVYGDELLTIEAADAFRAAARQHGFDERETLIAGPGFAWDQLLASTANLSLFGGRKLVDLRVPTGKPGSEGAEVLKRMAATASPDTVLLVCLPELSWQEEKVAWLGALGDAGWIVKSPTPSLEQLPGWLAARLKRQGQSADRETLSFLAERTEGNLLAAHQEVLKLGLLYPERALLAEEVRGAVLNVARYDLDNLREALLRRDLPRFARTLEGLRQEGEALPLILWALTEEIRALTLVKRGQAAGQPLPALLKEAKVWGLRQAAISKAVGALRLEQLDAAMKQLAQIDRMAKGVAAGNPWIELLRLGLALGA